MLQMWYWQSISGRSHCGVTLPGKASGGRSRAGVRCGCGGRKAFLEGGLAQAKVWGDGQKGETPVPSEEGVGGEGMFSRGSQTWLIEVWPY